MTDPESAGGIAAVASALAKPFEKLIDACAAGAGHLYEPVGIRRRAHAEADAQLILAEAKGRETEVALRAAHRLLDIEQRRQQNIEAVVEKARLSLPLTVSEKPVDPDWSARFFSQVEDVSNEDMQLLWGKLLAGEVAEPGSFSPRTLRIVSDLTALEAELFESLCSMRLLGMGRPAVFYMQRDELYPRMGLGWSEMQQLQAAGLVHDHGLSGLEFTATAGPTYFEAPGNVLFILTSDEPRSLPAGKISLTPAGVEMARLARWIWNDNHIRKCIAGWQSAGWNVSDKTIVNRCSDGNVEFTDREMPA